MSEKYVLELRNLKSYYRVLKGDVKAVDGVSFGVKRGEILGVAGESGCGKSTLANSLILRKPPLKHIFGQALLNGEDIMQMPPKEFRRLRLRKISVIPQYALDAFSPTKKIQTFISDLVREHGINPNRQFFDHVNKRLKIVNLDESVLGRYPIELSGGMKQRVVMVISTLLDPDLVIADEITSALDVSSQRFAATMLVNLRDQGIIGSAIFITHDLSILYQIADRILIMYAGHLAEIGPIDELIENPRHPYTQALISSLPKVGVQIRDERLQGIKGTPPELLDIEPGCRFRYRCLYRTDECEKTPQSEMVDRGHFVACWNYQKLGCEKIG